VSILSWIRFCLLSEKCALSNYGNISTRFPVWQMAATEIVIQIPLETKWTKWRVELDRWRRCYSFMQLQFGHLSKLGEMPIPMPEKRQLKNEIRFHSSEAQHFSFLCASRPKMSPMLLRLGVCLAMVSSAALFAFWPDPFGDRAYLNSR